MRKNTLLMLGVGTTLGTYPVKDFYLHISSGELVGLIGTEGSGKHTIYDILTGTVPITYGKIKYGNDDSFQAKNYLEHTRGIFIINRVSQIIKEYTVAETLFILEDVNYLTTMVSRKTMELEACRVFDQLGIHISPRKKMADLSDAEIKIVQIVRAYIKHAGLLILNDIMENAIQKDMEFILTLLKKVSLNGTAILWINSYPDAFNTFADKTVVIKNGYTACTMYADQYNELKLLSIMADDSGNLPSSMYKTSFNGQKSIIMDHISTKYIPEFSFSCSEGEILGIYDLSNQFSSQLLHIFLGDQKYKGKILVNGHLVNIKRTSDLIKNQIAIIDGKTYKSQIFGNMTLEKNITIAAEKKSAHFKLFANTHILSYAHKQRDRFLKFYPDSITGDELDRDDAIKTLLLRYVIAGAKVLICFQPFLGLDVNEYEEVINLLLSLKRRNITIVIINADKTNLNKVCDRILTITHKKILYSEENTSNMS